MPVEFRLKSTFRAGRLIRTGNGYRIFLTESDEAIKPEVLLQSQAADWMERNYRQIAEIPTAYFDLIFFTDPPVILPDLSGLRRIANDRAGLIICEFPETDFSKYDRDLAEIGFKQEQELSGVAGNTCYYYVLQQIGCCGITY